MGRYRILALDGGGVRGVITAVILERLLSIAPDLIDAADLLAGTSSGGILTLGLAAGLSPTRLRGLYERRGDDIFHHSRRVFDGKAGQAPNAGYDNVALCRELKDSLGESIRLGDLQKHVLVPSFDLDNEAPDRAARCWVPKLFHNLPGSPDMDRLIYRVALYTSAAPTYFPSVDGFIDGGVYANNPSMVAIAQAMHSGGGKRRPMLQELRVLSLGNGTVGRYIPGARHDWGMFHWLGAGLLDLINDASVAITDFQCRELLQERYLRFAPLLSTGRPVMLDESARVPGLVDYAERLDLSELAPWLAENW